MICKGQLLMGSLSGGPPRLHAITATSKLQSGDTKVWLAAWIDGECVEGDVRFPGDQVGIDWLPVNLNDVGAMVERATQALRDYGVDPDSPRDAAIRVIRAALRG